MRTLNKWTRTIHRWLTIPLLLAVLGLLAGTIINGAGFALPAWLTGIAVGTLLSLVLTGVYMFSLHYWAKWRRARS